MSQIYERQSFGETITNVSSLFIHSLGAAVDSPSLPDGRNATDTLDITKMSDSCYQRD